MALKIIVSYDDTDNDRDALALGRLLSVSGAELSLAYVRHSFGESLEQKEAEELLARGAESVGTPDMPKHVVVNPNTSEGLTELAEQEGADVIVFGSEYRTAQGLVKPGISAHKLLLGGPAAIAVAPAGLREHPSVSVNTVGVISEGDDAARQSADSLAGPWGPRWSSSAAVASTCSWSARAPSRRGQGHSQRLQRLRGRGRQLPGACRAARRGAQLRLGAGGSDRGRVTMMTAATSGLRRSIAA